MKSYNDLHYLPMSRIILPLCIILPPYYFPPIICPPTPGNCLIIYAIYPCPVSLCPLDSSYPLSFCPLIILPPIILPPGNYFMIYTIYLCLVSFCPSVSFCPPYHFAPWIHFTPYHFAPLSFCPLSFCPLEIISWFTLFTHVPYHFATALDFVFILIKSPLQQKLTTGAHPVTVAPLVGLCCRRGHGISQTHRDFSMMIFALHLNDKIQCICAEIKRIRDRNYITCTLTLDRAIRWFC